MVHSGTRGRPALDTRAGHTEEVQLKQCDTLLRAKRKAYDRFWLLPRSASISTARGWGRSTSDLSAAGKSPLVAE